MLMAASLCGCVQTRNDPLHWQNHGRYPCTAYFQGLHKHNGFTPGPYSGRPGPLVFHSTLWCGPTRPDSDHMPLEMRIFLSAAASPSFPPVQRHTPRWIWDGAKQQQYALALQARLRQASLQWSSAAAALGDLCQADGHFNNALKIAAQIAGLRQTRPHSNQPPHM